MRRHCFLRIIGFRVLDAGMTSPQASMTYKDLESYQPMSTGFKPEPGSITSPIALEDLPGCLKSGPGRREISGWRAARDMS